MLLRYGFISDKDLHESKIFILYILISVLSVVTFGYSFSGSFAFDDIQAIINNRDVSKSSISELFYHDFWGSNISSPYSHKSYRPLVVLSFKINYWVNGKLSSTSFHTVNIVLYNIICLQFYMFFSILFIKIENEAAGWLSFFSAMLFTVHPLHAENVSAIVGRADLMCSIFFLLAFFSYVKLINVSAINVCRIETITHVCTFVFFSACSLLSKEQGVTVFGICFIYDFILENKIINCCDDRKKLKKIMLSKHLLLRISLLIFLSLTFLTFRWMIMGSEVPNFQRADNPHSFVENPILRVLNYNYLYYLNAWLLINPWWLCFDWSMGCVPVINCFSDWRVFMVIFLNVVTSIFILSCFMKKNENDRNFILISIGVVVIPFLPSSNWFFRVGFVIAERNLLISSAGVCIIVVEGMNRLRTYFEKSASVMFILLLVSYFSRSVQRSSHWLNEETLFSAGTLVCPRNAKVHYNVAKLASDQGRFDIALKRYHLAIRLAPEYEQALNNLGNLYKEQKNFTMAEAYLTKSVSAKPHFAAGWMNLGIAQHSLKKFKAAELSYRTALSYKPHYPDCHYNLGNLYLDIDDHLNALAAWRNATLQNPHHIAAWTNMLILLDNLGLSQDVDVVARNALKHNPSESSIYFNFANSLGKVGRYEESERHFLLAIKYQQNMPKYHSNLGVLYHRWQKFDKAKQHYEIAIRLDPHNSHHLKNYKLLQTIHNN